MILYPTDTIYGLGVDATDPEAVSRLFVLKGRDEKKPISIVVSDIEMMRQYAEVTPLAEKLVAKFLPGKLTIVLNAKNLPDNLTAGTGTVGIRIPNHPVPMRLVRELGKPITATSANVAGRSTMNSVSEILSQFGERASMVTEVIDEGMLPESLPSTVVDARGERPVVLREGAIPAEALRTNI
ncbi:threonylcarbamoyl-AMP synthase [Patescibacteria group bacterium]|nr:threonylcarbamoyl-AMP synthase [Patescibacteria group bacterium]